MKNIIIKILCIGLIAFYISALVLLLNNAIPDTTSKLMVVTYMFASVVCFIELVKIYRANKKLQDDIDQDVE
jgi:hypothetical protein